MLGQIHTRRLVIATGNLGKLREFRSLFAELPFELTSSGELKLSSPEETGATFLANALDRKSVV